MESQFIALVKASEEIEWLQNFLKDIFCFKPLAPLCIQSDSQVEIPRAGRMCNNFNSEFFFNVF